MNDQIDIRAKNFKSQFLEMNKEIISDMRNQGASFQQIADFLYENKKTKVSSITISRFLKRNS